MDGATAWDAPVDGIERSQLPTSSLPFIGRLFVAECRSGFTQIFYQGGRVHPTIFSSDLGGVGWARCFSPSV
jgi:hypothetical protein